jgi:hypothetical protein
MEIYSGIESARFNNVSVNGIGDCLRCSTVVDEVGNLALHWGIYIDQAIPWYAP